MLDGDWRLGIVLAEVTIGMRYAFQGERAIHNRVVEIQTMDTDRIAGNWKQLKGKVKEKWGELTDDELTMIDGRREQLLGVLQEKYGLAREEAEKQIQELETPRGCC